MKIYIDGKPLSPCTPGEGEPHTENPARISELIDEISESLALLMYSTVADFGVRVEDAYTNAKMMHAAQVVVSVQRYLTYIANVAQTIYGKAQKWLDGKKDEDDKDKEESFLDKIFNGTVIAGGIWAIAEEAAKQFLPLENSIKMGLAKVSQVEGYVKQLVGLGSLKANVRVYAELIGELSALDEKVSAFIEQVNKGIVVYNDLMAQAATETNDQTVIEEIMNSIADRFRQVGESIVLRNADIQMSALILLNKAKKYRDEAIENCEASEMTTVYNHYEKVINKLNSLRSMIGKASGSVSDLEETMKLVRGHIMTTHYLFGQYGEQYDKVIKDYYLDTAWETVKGAYEDEEINQNFLAKVFPELAKKLEDKITEIKNNQYAKALNTLKEVYEAKEKFRSIGNRVQQLSNSVVDAYEKGGITSVLMVLGTDGADLVSEIEKAKPYCEFISNTLKLIQLANEEDEMTKAMGAFGDATLRLNYHTYAAVRNDLTTGDLTVDSQLIKELMALIEDAIIQSNEKSPGAFRPLTKEDKTAVAAYLVEYLNIQRAKYPRDETSDSNWMYAHVSGVMAALFEQLYVSAITVQATPQDLLHYMQNSDQFYNTGSLDGYLDARLEKEIFRDVRMKAVSKFSQVQMLVTHYSSVLAQNSSYPVDQIVRYLETLAQKMQASANIEHTVTRRYQDLDIWQLTSSSATQLSISTSYTLRFRDYQKMLLNVDVINNENMMATLDYYKAALYDLLVRSGLLVLQLSPNALSAAVGSSAASTWDSLSEKVFTALDESWKNRAALTAIAIGELAITMGATVMKEAGIANDIFDLIWALDKAIVFDPPLDTELVTFSVKDVVIPDGAASGTGEVLVTFRNDGDKTVAISPNVSIYTSAGRVSAAEFSSSSILIPAGQTAEFVGTFEVNSSVLLDSTGYSAVLTYAASEPETVSIAAEQGPFVIHFYAGTERQISAMRNRISAGTMVSGWVTGEDTLTGSITVNEGQNLRVFAAAPVNGDLVIEIISPSGEAVAATSFINDGDYAIIRNCEAGVYTVRVTTPAGFDNRITVEGVVSSFDKAVTAVYTETEALVNCNHTDDDGSYLGTLSLSVAESAGISAGAVDAALEFADEHLTASISGFGDSVLNAGGALNGSFVIKAAPDTPAGIYTGTLKVSFDAALCDPVFLSLVSGGDDADRWSFEGDRVVYTAQVSVTVDLSVPAAPEFTAEEGETEDTVIITGNAPGALLVILTYENDYVDVDEYGVPETYTDKTIAAIFEPDADGSFRIILTKPAQASVISAVAVNAAGGISAAVTDAVEGYTAPEAASESYADPFASVKTTQVEGKRDVTVTVYGAQISGLTVTGDVLYRVVDSEPSANFPTDAAFDPTGWINAGAVSRFTVKNVQSGQYIEVVQIVSENLYAADENGDPTVVSVSYSAVRHGSAAVAIEEVPGYTVSGRLVPDDVRADASGAVLTLTDAADSTVTYTAAVQAIDGAVSYTFTDVIAGTYILSLASADGKVKADSVLITVGGSDLVSDFNVKRNVFDVSGTVYSEDVKADLSHVTVILLGADGTELARTDAAVSGDRRADYRFSDLSIGDYGIRIVSEKVEAEDAAFRIADQDVTVDVKADSLIIPGDITGDRKVDQEDLERLFRYLTDWDVDVVEENLDVNGDGKVNNKDLTRLYQYLSLWDVAIY